MKWLQTILLKLTILTCISAGEALHFIGQIIDKSTKFPIEDVIIFQLDKEVIQVSNALGFFKIEVHDSPSIKLRLEKLGYKPIVAQFNYASQQFPTMIFEMEIQQLELPQVTVQSAFYSKTNIISNYDLLGRPISSGQEALNLIPGLFLAQHAGGGKAEQIFLRGYDIDHGTDLQLTVDGIPVNMASHAHGQGYADLHFIIPESIDRINYRKGPYDISDGNFATAGAAHFKTKKILSQNFIQAEYGQFGHSRFVGGINVVNNQSLKNPTNAYIMGELLSSRAYFDDPQNFHRINFFSKYNRNIGSTKKLELSFSIFDSKWDASGQIPERAVSSGIINRFGAIDPNEGGSSYRMNLNAMLSAQGKKYNLIRHQLYLTHLRFDLFSNFTFFLHDSINGDMIRQLEERYIIGYSGDWQKRFHLFHKNAMFKLGIGNRTDIIPTSQLLHMPQRNNSLSSPISIGNIHENNFSLFTDIDFQMMENLSFKSGLRADVIHFYADKNQIKASSWQKAISPRFTIQYTPNDKLLFTFKLGKGFHSNHAHVASHEKPASTLPAATGIELGMFQKLFDKMLIEVNVWQMETEDELVYVGDEGIVEINDAGIRKGIEVNLRFQVGDELFFDADLNYTNARFKNTKMEGRYIPLAARWTSTMGLHYNPKSPGLFAFLRYRFIADRPANENNSLIAPGSFICDAQLGYRIKSWEISVEVQNIFNKNWNEAQFETESRLFDEKDSVTELHFTPGTPFRSNLILQYLF
ncbi:MAG: TonB-dependent receptor [Saprospiraceae bacterium]|nr:TonB-dependent receptor [Saprospiraceae bacterium]